MPTFHRPERIEVNRETLTDSFGQFTALPFERGWATTMGNALRRILLSSVEGAAITAVRIEGALHEFTTVPGCSEDVIDLILNLKQIPLRFDGQGYGTMTLDVQGPAEITAKSLRTPGNLQVLDPTVHIATLNAECKLSMEIRVANGRGYVAAEDNKSEDLPIGFIPVDSSHSPVRKVAYTVEDTRVGQATDYDKLSMEVWTNGTVTPEEALGGAVRLLGEHLTIFGELASLAAPVTRTAAPAPSGDLKTVLDKPVEELQLSVRSFNCLKNANITTIRELVGRTEASMLKTKNFGRKSLDEINEVLAGMGLSLGMNV